MGKNNKLKLGIVGYGNIGRRHHLTSQKFFDIVCICDNKVDLNTIEDPAIRCYQDLDEMLRNEHRNLDIVSIATPNHLHFEHTMKVFDYNLNVLVEKPMALNERDCMQMIRRSEELNKRLFVVKQNRFNPPVIEIKDRLDKGELGKIMQVHLSCYWNRNFKYYQSDWRGSTEKDGGILFTQFSHFIDLLIYLVGPISNARSISSNFNHDYIEIEDSVSTIFEFENGALGSGSFSINAHSCNYEGAIILICEKGTLKIGGKYLNKIEYYDGLGENPNMEEYIKPNTYEGYFGSMSNHDLVYKNVHEVLMKNKAITTTHVDGLLTVRAIEMIYKNVIVW
tara:strand:+ start:4559 stop:5569 length:1011 start_codon:yes stop_codon:yes gene_type:complete